MTECKTKISINIRTKKDVIEFLEKGHRQVEARKKFGLHRSTVNTIWKKRHLLMNEFHENKNHNARRFRKSPFNIIEKPLLQWFQLKREEKVTVSGPLLRQKATEYANKLGLVGFTASDGWLHRFKKRNNIEFRAVNCVQSGSSQTQTEKQWLSETLPSLLKGYSDDEIYNCDDTGFFFQLLPNETQSFKGAKCEDGSMSDARISALFCVNKSGTHKLKPVVIGSTRLKNNEALPIDYRKNSKAWTTKKIFHDFLHCFDVDLQRRERKALLLVDSYLLHSSPVPNTLRNLKVSFFPSNTTSKLQPLEAEIITIIKRNYRRELIFQLIQKMDHEGDFGWKPSLSDAIEMIYDGWSSITPEKIHACFEKCWGQDSSRQNEPPSSEDQITETLLRERFQMDSFNDFVNVDENLVTCSFVSDEDILDGVSHSDEIPETENAPKVIVTRSHISSEDALSKIYDLRKFFLSNPTTEDSVFLKLSELESAVLSSTVKYEDDDGVPFYIKSEYE